MACFYFHPPRPTPLRGEAFTPPPFMFRGGGWFSTPPPFEGPMQSKSKQIIMFAQMQVIRECLFHIGGRVEKIFQHLRLALVQQQSSWENFFCPCRFATRAEKIFPALLLLHLCRSLMWKKLFHPPDYVEKWHSLKMFSIKQTYIWISQNMKKFSIEICHFP